MLNCHGCSFGGFVWGIAESHFARKRQSDYVQGNHGPPRIHSEINRTGDKKDRKAQQEVGASEGGTRIAENKDGKWREACFQVFRNPQARFCDQDSLPE